MKWHKERLFTSLNPPTDKKIAGAANNWSLTKYHDSLRPSNNMNESIVPRLGGNQEFANARYAPFLELFLLSLTESNTFAYDPSTPNLMQLLFPFWTYEGRNGQCDDTESNAAHYTLAS